MNLPIHVDRTEIDDLLDALRDQGFGDILDVLAGDFTKETGAYTKGGRVNKSKLARILGQKPNVINDRLRELTEAAIMMTKEDQEDL